MPTPLDAHVSAYQGNSLYDFDNEIILKWYPNRIVTRIRGAAPLLELGIGHGYSTDFFSRHVARHVVIEGSPAVIQHFRQSHPDCSAEIVEAYFEDFSTDERFAAIVMGFILEHVDDPVSILKRYKEFLAPGGQIFLAVPNAEALNRRIGHAAGVLEDMSTLSEYDLLSGHKRYYTAARLRAEIAFAGYRVAKLEGIYLKPFTTQQIVSLSLERKFIDAMCEVGVDYPELSCGILAEIQAA